MIEPQPLGMNNVMFCFICLGFGVCFSLIKVTMEFMTKKINRKQKVTKSNVGGGNTRATTRQEKDKKEVR